MGCHRQWREALPVSGTRKARGKLSCGQGCPLSCPWCLWLYVEWLSYGLKSGEWPTVVLGLHDYPEFGEECPPTGFDYVVTARPA